MARVYIPPMTKVPEGATPEQREKMFQDYRDELILRNPGHFNPDGSLKTFWQWFSELFKK